MIVKAINNSGFELPKYETDGAAGMDIKAKEDWVIYPCERAIIETGLHVEVPKGFEIQIRPRSGNAARRGITVLNSPGTIDSDFRGEIKVILYNTGNEIFAINKGDRIAQMVLCPVYQIEWEEVTELKDTARGSGGFGSTGK